MTQRKKSKLPPCYYLEKRAVLAAQGKTAPKAAENTKKSLATILKKWTKFCDELGHPPTAFLKNAEVPDFKTFWKWTLDRYNGIGAASSLKNYWRVLKMYALDKADRDFEERERRDIHNYINLLVDEYKLRINPQKKSVISLDDLYLLLHTHWVLDDSIFKDERQRVQVATGILMAAFFGCRPCSLFDTRVKVDEPDEREDPAIASTLGARKHTKDDYQKIDQPSETAWDSNRKGDNDSDSDSGSDSDNNSDIGSCFECSEGSDTDDDCDAGPEETRSFLYRHFTIIIVANDSPAKPNLVFMKATLLHTKGEDRNPRIKTLVVGGGDEDPLFSLLDHLLSLAVHDDAFEAAHAKYVRNLFLVKIPAGRKSLTLKWKRDALDVPIFREPLRGTNDVGTSLKAPLLASTWITYLKRLGQKAGFERSFTQYGLRRGLLNVVNQSAPASVRDQLFDHQQGAVGYYLDKEVRLDTEACFLGKPSNEIVQRMARLASLTADARAPRELSLQQKTALQEHPRVVRLSQRNRALTERIRSAGYRKIGDCKGTPLFAKKKRAEARLNCFKIRLRQRMVAQARKRHFRKADTMAFDAQFSPTTAGHTFPVDAPATKAVAFNIQERAEVVRLTCVPTNGLSDQENLQRRIHAIEARVALCCRRETQRRGRPPPVQPPQQEFEDIETESGADADDPFPLPCKALQCIFCLGDERLSYTQRTFEYKRTNKMRNEVERHLLKFAPDDAVPCPHPQCRAAGVEFSSIEVFKNHTHKIHKIQLRG